jgi:hypothetical protein
MAKKAVFVDLEKQPDLYAGLQKLAKQNYTGLAPIVKIFIEKGLKESGIKVSGKKNKLTETDSKKA